MVMMFTSVSELLTFGAKYFAKVGNTKLIKIAGDFLSSHHQAIPQPIVRYNTSRWIQESAWSYGVKKTADVVHC